jgi:hypothetical protein
LGKVSAKPTEGVPLASRPVKGAAACAAVEPCTKNPQPPHNPIVANPLPLT